MSDVSIHSHRAEENVRHYSRLMAKLKKKWQEKEEALKRQENRRLSIERARREKYHELHQNGIEGKYIHY